MKLRTEEFRARLVMARAQWSKLPGGQEVVARHGDLLTDYWAVREGGVGLCDRSERETLVLSGKDTISWLQGLVTSDLLTLRREGSGQRSTMVDHVGKTLADLRILHLPNMLMLDLEPGGLSDSEVVKHLDHHVIMEQVKVEDRTAQTARLTLTGRDAPKILGQISKLHHPVSMLREPYQGSWGELGGCDVVVQRIELTGEPTFDISCSRQEALTVWEAIMSHSDQVRAVGEEALEVMRLEAGVVRFGTAAYHRKIIPIEADLNDTISYTKGCYLGQEIIHRLDTRGTPAKLLRAVMPRSASARLEVGDVLLDEGGKRVGEVVEAVESPLLDDLVIGRAMLKRGSYAVGTLLRVDGGEVEVEVGQLDAPWRRAMRA